MKRKIICGVLAAVMVGTALPMQVLAVERNAAQTVAEAGQGAVPVAVTLYALDGRTIQVWDYEVEAYVAVGWFEKEPEQAKVVTLYAPDGRTIQVWDYEVAAYLAVGWFEAEPEQSKAVTLYASDGRTVQVWDYEVPTYVAVGWFETKPNEARSVTLYALDGRNIQVWDYEVSSYVAVGWYETKPEPKTSTTTTYYGNTVYVTRTGKKYHYNSNCNGGTYYESTLEAARRRGLTPCQRCAK